MIRKALSFLLFASLAGHAGCAQLAFFGYLFAPDEKAPKTVEADYKGPSLSKHSLAIVVYVDQRVRFEQPTAQEHVANAVASQLASEDFTKAVKDVRVINPSTVLDYQDKNIRWDEMDKTALGKALGADYVLMVSLIEFSTREPMSVNILRGVATAEVRVYKTSLPERQCCVYKPSEDIRVIFPSTEKAPYGVPGYDDRIIRQTTVEKLAEQIVWKLYKHKEPVEDKS